MKTKFNGILALLLALVVQISFAQEKTVSGTISDDSGTLPGVSVVIKGTSIGTDTDFDGKFSIKAKDGDVLSFSYLGYKTAERKVGSSSVIDVKLQQTAESLDEIVITGVASGTSVKKLTVSVTKVSEEALKMAPASSVAGALVGKVAGARVQMGSGAPGAGTQIQLRTDNNLNAGSSPLIIMDGVIINTSLNDINIDDVESMEVVKGAAAAALYGSRAANGVINIVSKRGNRLEVGTSKVVVRNEIGFQEITKLLHLAKASPYKLASDWNKGTYTAYDGVTYPANYVSGFHPGIVGSRTIDDDHYLDNPFAVTRNQQREYFKVGQTMTKFISYSSNSEKTNVYGSFEDTEQSGVIPYTDGYQRQNYRINIDHQVAPWMKFSMSNLFTDNKTRYPGGGGGFFAIVLAEPDNDLHMDNPVDGQPHYLRHNQWSNEVNPFYGASKQEAEDRSSSWITNFKVNVKLTDWANVDLTHSREVQNSNYSSYTPFDTWTIGSGGDNEYGLVYNKGSLYKSNTVTRQNNTQATLNLSHSIDDLIIKGKISVLQETNDYNYFTAGSSQFAIRDLPTLDAFTEMKSFDSTHREAKSINYFGIVSLDYKDRYLFDGMYRRDGSSYFGPDARWSDYYRASAAYRISQDVKIPGIQELKVRVATGTAGIRPGFNWQYETYSINAGSTSPGQKGNKSLKPSQTQETEVGLDIDFLEKFRFQGTYAKSVTSDQFLSVPLIPFVSDGFTSQWQNAGTIEANTLELSLSANWINKGDFSWSTNVVFGQSEQMITKLPIAPYQSGPDGLFFIKEGETFGSIYGYDWVRTLGQMSGQLGSGETIADYEVNNEGYVVPLGSQGLPSEQAIRLKAADGSDAFVKIGDGLPKFTLGLSNTIRYKGAFLYFLIDVKSGGDVYNRKSQWLTRDLRNGIMDMSNVAEGSKKAYDYYSKFYDVNSNNKFWVEDASYVKLRELSIGYTLDTQLPASLNIFKSISGKVIGRNLLTFTNYSGYDPEVGSIRSPFDDTGSYPNFRNIAFSLSFEF
jgi:TonB-linked SusC/RagA family outer membrane protein